ncbi:excinuclease ABC subunit C [Vogesella indigofera]|uniref:UvrABC system protein C n=1 Tax=Vogesella indigofera TaxID=45465 RepID=A0A495BAH5_VOGIN|nr:excinuclease ABC subunit UvrC [Vogesella indigofera]RKQ57939.1 excinuclease ABC subunit C [Vogesella indigofera]
MATKPPAFDAKAFLANLPSLPGVYRMLDAAGNVLYVGKAIDLKKRVSSYFQKSDHSPRIQLMVRQIAAIDTTVVRSEAEALILENNLIKALTPKYNILFRDDKSYPYLMVSGHAFPQLAYFRGEPKKPHQYFGPYPNGYAVRESIQVLQKVFRLRTCEDSVFANRSRPCLLFQIKRCSAPCTGEISSEAYRADVQSAVTFLQGKHNELIDLLTARMLAASDAMHFEQAAELRDQIQALARVQEKQFISSNTSQLDADVIAIASEGGVVCVNLVMIRGGRHLGDKSLFPLNAADSLAANLEAFLAQHYLGAPLPAAIIHNETVAPELQQLLVEQAQKRLVFISNPIGERRVWLEMAQKNAQLAISQRLASAASQNARLAALAQLMEVEEVARLECFDISHTMGEATVASCVVYDRGGMQPSEYRRFNIETAAAGDDYGAMREALTRRYSKLAAGEGRLPDVLLIDGGKGQVGVALEVLAEVGVDVPIVGVAKGESRKPGLETLIVPHLQKTLQLPRDHAALHLIQTVRDEAHRFAITGHRARRAKARTSSTLEDIAGVGPTRRQRLLTRFGGLRGVVAASIDDLAQVDGISRALAEKIYQALH